MRIPVIALLLLSILLPMRTAIAGGPEQIPDCLIDLGPCTSTVANRQVMFDISPRPIRTASKITFTIRVVGRNSAPTLLIGLSMPGMQMGRNEVILKKMPDGSYQGGGMIPRCPDGRSLWRAEVIIPGSGKVSYLFTVSE